MVIERHEIHKYKDFSQLYAKPEDFDGYAFVVKQIGLENIPGFESWAFKSSNSVAYDDSARFLWNNAHRTTPLTGSLKEAINEMIRLWKDRSQ